MVYFPPFYIRLEEAKERSESLSLMKIDANRIVAIAYALDSAQKLEAMLRLFDSKVENP